MKKYQRVWIRIGLITGLLLSILNVSSFTTVSAHTEDVHQWITSRAIDYLENEGMIEEDSWFHTNRRQFEETMRWGAWYADNTGPTIEMPGDVSWMADAQTHYFKEGDVYVVNGWAEVVGGIAQCDWVHTGDLNAPGYAAQLYRRAFEFWPGGTKPLDLGRLREIHSVYSLGYTGCKDRQFWFSWGQGTDPNTIWHIDNYVSYETRHSHPEAPAPAWPSWTNSGKENEVTAVRYLGWSAHLIQDMSVYHHVLLLQGKDSVLLHKGYEQAIDKMVREYEDNHNDLMLADLPITTNSPMNSNMSLQGDTKISVIGAETAPNYYRTELVSFGITDLANKVAYYGGQRLLSLPFDQDSTEFRQKIKQYQILALDNAIKATAALIYKFMYEVSEQVYVDSSYHGNQDGSIGHPFNTLSDAVIELSNRPTKTIIKIADGIYSQSVIIDKPCILERYSRPKSAQK